MRSTGATIALWGIVAIVSGREARAEEPTPSMAHPAADGASADVDGSAPASTDRKPSGAAADPLPGPAPFSETAPLLPEMWRLATARDAGSRALAAGLEVLEDWLARPTNDPLARASGEYLRAKLLTRRGQKAEARAAWEALAMTPGAFSDVARLALAELEPRASSPRAGGAAHWLLTRTPGAVGYLAGAKKAVADLAKRKQGARAAELLADALGQGMSEDARHELLLLRAGLLPSAEAKALLLDAWWLDADDMPDPRIGKQLKKLRAAPDADAVLFRDALATSRSGAEKAKKVFERSPRPVAEIAAALCDRFDDESATAALKRLDRSEPSLAKSLRDTPYLAYGRAVILRKLDRDAEAVVSFADVIEHFPDHPLADLSRAQASVLLRALGRPREADVLDEALLAGAPPGGLERDALWRLGFGAVLRADGKVAERHLRELEQRYGGDPDRHSFCWFERARYWRGRAAQVEGDRSQAEDHFKAVLARFPAGWYALLARDRLKLPAGIGRRDADAMWDIERDDPMATALALYRLGAEMEARETFAALLEARQLPGNGRKLLADLWDLEGETQKADRVLRYAAIPATMPGDDPDDLYLTWYPFAHGEAVTDAAHDNHLPSQLLAGIVSVETRFQEKGRSRVGAIGLAQLMPTTGQAVGKKIFGDSFKAQQLWDPATNLAVAAKYLGSLLDRFEGHPALAVLAYNAGPAPVKRWLADRGRLELDAFVETVPFEQARRYVMRVLSDAEIYRRLYGLESEPMSLPRALGN